MWLWWCGLVQPGLIHRDPGIDTETVQKRDIVADDDKPTPKARESIDEFINALEVEVVGRLVEDQQLVWWVRQEYGGQGDTETFAT